LLDAESTLFFNRAWFTSMTFSFIFCFFRFHHY